MSHKKHVYKHRVQFVPRACDDLLKDDPTASKNVIIPLEPESWKYGIYFDDGYNYEQHLMTLDEFRDETREMPSINTEKKLNMLPSKAIKYATVIDEVEINEEHQITANVNDIDNLSSIGDAEKMYDDLSLQKLRKTAGKDLDEDILFALNNAKESYELAEDELFEDNFIELADQAPTKSNIDSDALNRFFGEDIYKEQESDAEEYSDEEIFDLNKNMGGDIEEISQLQRDYREMKVLNLPDQMSTRSSMSLAVKSTIERFQQKEEKQREKKFIQPIEEDLKRFVVPDESEYDEADVDKVVDEWLIRKKTNVTSVFDVKGKECTFKIPVVTVANPNKKRKADEESMDTGSSECSEENQEDFVLPNVSQFHVPRPKGETAIEKRERKKNIKVAKRCRQEKKKEIKQIYAALK